MGGGRGLVGNLSVLGVMVRKTEPDTGPDLVRGWFGRTPLLLFWGSARAEGARCGHYLSHLGLGGCFGSLVSASSVSGVANSCKPFP